MKRTICFIIGLCAALVLSIPLISYAYKPTYGGDLQGVVYMDGVGGLDNATVRLYSGPNESGTLMSWITTATFSGTVGYYRFSNIPASASGTTYYLSVRDNQNPKRFADNLSTPVTLYSNQMKDCNIKVTSNSTGVSNEIYFADNYASLQDAIDACSAAGGGMVYAPYADYTITAPITLTVPLELIIDGNITSTIENNAVFIVNPTNQTRGGRIAIAGNCYGPNTSDSTLIKQISGKYWHYDIRHVSGGSVRFGKVWHFAPNAQASRTFYTNNVMITGAWAIDNIWKTEPEPTNVAIEGNMLISTEAITKSGIPILIQGGKYNIFKGSAHSEALLADIDDSASRGNNIFISTFVNNPDKTLAALHNTSLLILPEMSKIPKLYLADVSLINQLGNGSFETGNPPIAWSLAGAGATAERSTEQIKTGSYSVKLTRVGTDVRFYQNHSNYAYYKNRYVTLGAWVYATVADRARIDINDGVGYTFSSYHSGTPGWEWLTATHLVDANATRLWSGMRLFTGDTSAYYDGAILVEGKSCPAFSPKPVFEQNKNSGSSRGTGAQQTIAHGLAATPTKVKITPTSTGADAYRSAASDATNIYITAVSGKTYDWEAEF